MVNRATAAQRRCIDRTIGTPPAEPPGARMGAGTAGTRSPLLQLVWMRAYLPPTRRGHDRLSEIAHLRSAVSSQISTLMETEPCAAQMIRQSDRLRCSTDAAPRHDALAVTIAGNPAAAVTTSGDRTPPDRRLPRVVTARREFGLLLLWCDVWKDCSRRVAVLSASTRAP
jgi:hypothetical protein